MTAVDGPSLFISYAREDAGVVRGLVRELRSAGIAATIDELEHIALGDLLSPTLKASIDRADFLVIVLSPASVASPWVVRELEWGMETERAEGRVKVLPLITEKCDVPALLKDKLRFDMTTPGARTAGMLELRSRLGADRYATTRELYPTLDALARQADTKEGVATATLEAIEHSELRADVVRPFMDELASRATDESTLAIAIVALGFVDRYDSCHHIVEEFVRDGRDFSVTLATYALSLTRPDSLMWWHRLATGSGITDATYQTLMSRHAATLLEHDYQRVAGFLLTPDRGPGNYNVESFVCVMLATESFGPFETRWQEWVRAGRFDGIVAGGEDPDILYWGIEDGMRAKPELFRRLWEQCLEHVRYLLKSGTEEQFRAGLRHLNGMVRARVTQPQEVISAVIRRVYSDEMEDITRLARFERALRLVAEFHATDVGEGRREVESRIYEALRVVPDEWARGAD